MRAHQSLRYRLPLLISTLLCVVVGALGWSAYRQLESVLLQSADRRLNEATQQLSALLDQSLDRTRREAVTLADDAAFARVLAHPTDSASLDRARLILGAARDVERAQSSNKRPRDVSFALWSSTGQRLMTVGPATVGMDRAPRPTPASPRGPAAAVTVAPLVRTGAGVAFELVAPVAGRTPDAEGYLVSYRVLSGDGVEAINQLIGADASFLIGNPDGRVWTDLTRAVAGPPGSLPRGVPTEYVNQRGERVVGVAGPIPNTPWLIWIGVPRKSLLAPADTFLTRLAAGALVLIALGALGAWLLSRQFTAPLAEVTRAAEDVARGDYSRRVRFVRDDEIGSLGRSFDSMAAQVQSATDALHAHATALKSAHDEMREGERRYRQLVEFSPDAVVVHRDGVIVFANPAAFRLYAASSPDEVVGQPIIEFVPLSDRAELSARAHRSQVDREPLPFAERRTRRLNGEERSVEAASTPFNLDGRPSVLTILRDISGRKRLEDQVRQAQKMEAVGQLAGGIAHDFNNLLMAIQGYGGFVLDSFGPGDARRADVEEMLKASTRAATLTRQLLAFSRQQMLQPRVLDLNSTVGDLAPMLGRLVGTDMQLESRLDPALGAVRADPGQVEQVLVNLVVNARDAMPDGGAITVQTANVDLGEESRGQGVDLPPGRYVMLAVSDSGCGMDRATQARIFEPFYTTKPVGQGTGLGLSTVYGIVQQSGGFVSVYSEPGQGTTFKVYLPRVDEPPDAPTREVDAAPAAKPTMATILVVEDEAAVRSVMRRFLVRAGYAVLEATNGAEALGIVGSTTTPIDLVITDLVMPEMGGRALATALHARWPDTRLIYVSGFTRDAAGRRGGLEPGSGFLEKPFTGSALITQVEAVLSAARSAA